MKRWRHIHSSKLNTEETSLVRPSVAASASRSLAYYQPSSSEHSRSINNNRCQGRIVRIFRYKYQIFAFLTLSRAWRGLEAHFNCEKNIALGGPGGRSPPGIFWYIIYIEKRDLNIAARRHTETARNAQIPKRPRITDIGPIKSGLWMYYICTRYVKYMYIWWWWWF